MAAQILASKDEKKTFDPHVVICWLTDGALPVINEYAYREDAEDKYEELKQLKMAKVILSRVIKQHGEG